jgi:hypothetical protein
MEKTMNILIVETKDQIMNTLVVSQLPAMVLSMILKEIKDSVDIQANQILENEKKVYIENLDAEQKMQDVINKKA